MSYLSGYDDTNGHVLQGIRNECARQQSLKAAGRFAHTCRDEEVSDAARAVILMEEVGEVARAVLETTNLANDKHDKSLRKELIQVAAVCTSWVQGMDEREEKAKHAAWLAGKEADKKERERIEKERVRTAGLGPSTPEGKLTT